MKSLFIVCAAVACTIGATACMTGEGGTATSPIDPFGTDPALTTGNEPTGGDQVPIAQLCVQVCARIISTCGSSGTDASSCASECAADSPPNCEAEFRVFLQCLATATLDCGGSFAPACQGAAIAADACESSTGAGGTGTAGGTGAAGATGTR